MDFSAGLRPAPLFLRDGVPTKTAGVYADFLDIMTVKRVS